MSSSALFEQVTVGGLTLASRIVMAPMTRNFSPNGVPGEDVAAYYARRGQARVGLIISEGTGIDRPAALACGPSIPRFHGADSLGGWRRVADRVHAAGGRMAPQLWHTGASTSSVPGWTLDEPTESPSGLLAPGQPQGRAMGDVEIADTIAAYARAAAEARLAGFDAVEIHAAHGYLIDQFLWESTNQRTDVWGGGTLAERAAFATEIVRGVRQAVGPDFPILIRLSQWKVQDYTAKLARSPNDLESLVTRLADAGVDLFHCSQRRYWEPEFAGSDLNFAGWIKKLSGRPTITVGSVGLSSAFIGDDAGPSNPAPLDELLRRLDRGDFDLVAVGRALLADPEWAAKVELGRTDELMPFSYEAATRLI